jgi:2-methylisocitrate lyase-like PEP mutase family enzyme
VVFTVADLNAAGVKRISLGSSLARLAYGSLIRAATEMRDSGSFSFAGDAAGFAEIEKHF